MPQGLLPAIASISVAGLLLEGDTTTHTPGELAVGAIRKIISSQVVHKQTFPEAGYACTLEPLLEADESFERGVPPTR